MNTRTSPSSTSSLTYKRTLKFALMSVCVGAFCLSLVVALNSDREQSAIDTDQLFNANTATNHETLGFSASASEFVRSTNTTSIQNDGKPEQNNGSSIGDMSANETSDDAMQSETHSLTHLASPSVTESAIAELNADAGLSPNNLMLLQELSQRISVEEFGQLTVQLPEYFVGTLHKLINTHQAELMLHREWQNKALLEPERFRLRLEEVRKVGLGEALYTQLHATDVMTVSADFYAAELYDAEIEAGNELQNGRSTQDVSASQFSQKDALIDVNRAQSADYRSKTTDALSNTKNNNLDAGSSAQLEHAFQQRLSAFLDEYQFVESAGLSGNDEQLVRTEMLTRHFDKEDIEFVNLYLFSPQNLDAVHRQADAKP